MISTIVLAFDVFNTAKEISNINSAQVITTAGLLIYNGIITRLLLKFYGENEAMKKEKIVDLEKRIAEGEAKNNMQKNEIEFLKEQLKNK